jgi:hypothetical protein
MSEIFRTQQRAAAGLVLAVSVLLCNATPASAQQGDGTVTTFTTVADQSGQPSAAATDGPFWELIGGFEADTHGSAYGFFGPGYVHPIRPNLAWTARAFANYLAYEFTGADGETQVRSPGLSASAGLRFGGKNWFGVNAGPEVRWRRTELTRPNGQTIESDETSVGANVGAEAYVNPTSHNNLHAIVNYGTVDKYTWARVGFKEQISNRSWQGSNATFLGVEVIGQGNDDIRSTQIGGFFEVTRVPANLSLMFKVGYKRSTFDVGPNKTGPYVAVGFYKRLG